MYFVYNKNHRGNRDGKVMHTSALNILSSSAAIKPIRTRLASWLLYTRTCEWVARRWSLLADGEALSVALDELHHLVQKHLAQVVLL